MRQTPLFYSREQNNFLPDLRLKHLQHKKVAEQATNFLYKALSFSVVQFSAETHLIWRNRRHKSDASWINKSNVKHFTSSIRWTSSPAWVHSIRFQVFPLSRTEEHVVAGGQHSQIHPLLVTWLWIAVMVRLRWPKHVYFYNSTGSLTSVTWTRSVLLRVFYN